MRSFFIVLLTKKNENGHIFAQVEEVVPWVHDGLIAHAHFLFLFKWKKACLIRKKKKKKITHAMI